jgi:hypothetical protein
MDDIGATGRTREAAWDGERGGKRADGEGTIDQGRSKDAPCNSITSVTFKNSRVSRLIDAPPLIVILNLRIISIGGLSRRG